MPTIVGVAGSLRKKSYNAALLRAAVGLTPPGTLVEVASIHGIPLYDGDIEASSGIPDVVRDLKNRIAGADGVLLVSPEYNHSIPGVMKNAIDWLSRPASDIGRVFRDRPVALIGATPGLGGTILAQAAWLPVLRALGVRPWFGPRFHVSSAGKVFNDEGALMDEQVRKKLQDFMTGFAEFVAGSG
jgi:chromate reductase, NAD(P)H dehydrogenase (quinone)